MSPATLNLKLRISLALCFCLLFAATSVGQSGPNDNNSPNNTLAVIQFSGCEGGSTNIVSDITGNAYQWQMNSGSGFVGVSNGSSFSGTTTSQLSIQSLPLAWEGYEFRCLVDATPSSSFILHVKAQVKYAVTLSASATTICPSGTVTFTASSVPNVTSAFYLWQRNRNDIGWAPNSPVFPTNVFNDGDSIRLILISLDSCSKYHYDTSNTVRINIIGGGVAVVTANTPSIEGCPGSTFTFTTQTMHGGASPSYQWRINGNPVPGATAPTFASNSLVYGDYVSVVMTPTPTSCPVQPVVSNSHFIKVLSNATPTVNITTNTPGICPGAGAVFQATVTNPGDFPVYQWKINGANVPGTISTYYSNPLNNGDQISVVVTSSNVCPAIRTATSNVITMFVGIPPSPTVTASVSSATICPGANVTFTMTPANPGTNPSFEWKKNGVVVAGGQFYYTNTIANGDVVTGSVTYSPGCLPNPAAVSNPITMTVLSAVPLSVSIAGNTSVVSGGATILTSTNNQGLSTAYQWQDSTAQHNWGPIPGGTNSTLTYVPAATGVKVRCLLTGTTFCVTPLTAISNVLTFNVSFPTAVSSISRASIKVYPNPVTSVLYIDSLDAIDGWQSAVISSVDGRENLLQVNLVNRRSASVNVMMLPAGVYFATFRKRNGAIYVMKFVKL